jgi:hypothetical protein
MSEDLPPELSRLDPAIAGRSRDNSQGRARDPVGIAAIVVGCLGLVAFGIVLAIVTAMLAGIAGQRAREQRRSFENAYIAFALAGLDGIVWLVLHFVFDLKFVAG